MRSQVEQCALLDRLAYSDGIDEPVRKVGLTGAAVTGIRAADKHAHRIEQKSKEKSQQCKYYGTTNHFFNHPPSTTRLSGRWGPENRENQREIGKLGLGLQGPGHPFQGGVERGPRAAEIEPHEAAVLLAVAEVGTVGQPDPGRLEEALRRLHGGIPRLDPGQVGRL